MRLYGDYVINELGELDTDYVFVNLWEGGDRSSADLPGGLRPLSPTGAHRTGVHIRPHKQRHSHATDLLRTGKWHIALVQKRLGHRHITTTAKYLHLLDDELKAAHQDYLRRREARPQPS